MSNGSPMDAQAVAQLLKTGQAPQANQGQMTSSGPAPQLQPAPSMINPMSTGMMDMPAWRQFMSQQGGAPVPGLGLPPGAEPMRVTSPYGLSPDMFARNYGMRQMVLNAAQQKLGAPAPQLQLPPDVLRGFAANASARDPRAPTLQLPADKYQWPATPGSPAALAGATQPGSGGGGGGDAALAQRVMAAANAQTSGPRGMANQVAAKLNAGLPLTYAEEDYLKRFRGGGGIGGIYSAGGGQGAGIGGGTAGGGGAVGGGS